MSTESRLRWKYITILLATGEVISTHGKLFGTMDAIDMLLITSKLMPEELDEEHFINMSSRDSVELVGNLFFQARHEGSLRYISYRGKYTPTADTSKRLEALVREFFSLTTEEMLELCSRAYDLLCKHGNGWNVIHELNLRSSPAT